MSDRAGPEPGPAWRCDVAWNPRTIVQTPSGESRPRTRGSTSSRSDGSLRRLRRDHRLGLASGGPARLRRSWAFRSRGPFTRSTMTSPRHEGPDATSAVAVALRACAAALEQLAVSIEQPTREDPRDHGEPPGSCSWPEVMSTRLAASYCGYKTSSALRKAHLDGKVFPVGRRGGVGSLTWSRADLDTFLRGGRLVEEEDRHLDAADAHGSTSGGATPTPMNSHAPLAAERAFRRGRGVSPERRKLSPAVEASLRRLEEIGRPPRSK